MINHNFNNKKELLIWLKNYVLAILAIILGVIGILVGLKLILM